MTDRCDQIVNSGTSEPTECGRTLPCEYHPSMTNRQEKPATEQRTVDVRKTLHGIASLAHLAWTSPDTIMEAFETIEEMAREAEAVMVEREAQGEPAPLDDERLIDIIEQAIFETDTGLEAALLASERIIAEYSLSAQPSTEPAQGGTE